MWISTRSSLTVLLLGEQASRTRRARAFDFAWRAFGEARTHSSSRASARRRADSCFSSVARRACFCSSQRRVVALERDALAAVELENPPGDVVEEVPVVRDGDDGARRTRRGSARARRPTRRRDGSSARRAAGDPAPDSSSRQSATRRRSPPESVSRPGRRRGRGARPSRGRASASSDHASARSICSCTFACSAISASKSASGSANAAEIGVEAVEKVTQRPDAVLDVPADGLCADRAPAPARAARRWRRPRAAPGRTRAPRVPAMIRSSVDLPAPFGPSTPIFAPGRNASVMSVENLALRAVELRGPDHREDVVAHPSGPGYRLPRGRLLFAAWVRRDVRRTAGAPRPEALAGEGALRTTRATRSSSSRASGSRRCSRSAAASARRRSSCCGGASSARRTSSSRRATRRSRARSRAKRTWRSAWSGCSATRSPPNCPTPMRCS